MTVGGSSEVVKSPCRCPSLPRPELLLTGLVLDKATEHAITVVIVVVEVLYNILWIDILKPETVSLCKLFNGLPIVPDGSEAAAE